MCVGEVESGGLEVIEVGLEEDHGGLGVGRRANPHPEPLKFGLDCKKKLIL